MNRTHLTTLIALVALSTGCFALHSRIEGTNFGAEDAPFIADSAPQIESNAALPEQAGLIHRVVLVGDAGVPMDSEPVLESLGRWADVYEPDVSTADFERAGRLLARALVDPGKNGQGIGILTGLFRSADK